jgi:hypothetical protein
MTTHLVSPPGPRPAGPTHEGDKGWAIGSMPEPHEGGLGRAAGVGRRARSRERDVERRRVWLFDVERRSAVLCSGALYLVSVGIVMILGGFAACLVGLWTIGPVN